MVARIIEKPDFVEESEEPIRRKYHFQVVGTPNASTARSMARNHFGPVISTPFGTLYRGGSAPKQREFNQWDVFVEYITRPLDIGSVTWDADGTGVNENIKYSISEVAKYPSATAPPSGNAIGYDGREIKGTDIIVPAGSFNVTVVHPAGVITEAYYNYLKDLAGYVNSVPWRVYDQGEVRFMGPRCSSSTETQSSCVYAFETKSNETGIQVGTITGIDKEGWDVLDIRFQDETETVGSNVHGVRIPEFVYIHRVAPRIDFQSAFGF